MTKKLSSIALAVATTGAALVGTGVAAPDAAAQIAGGEYVYTAVTKTPYGSVPASQDATVRGNKLVSHSPTGPVVFTITPTATGGKFRLRDNVFILDRKANGRYAGPVLKDGKVVGRNTLVPRR